MFALLLISIAFQTNSLAQNCLTFTNEDNIDVFPHRNDANEATPKIALFTANVKYAPNINLNALAVQIKTTELCVLQAEAIKQQTTLAAANKCTNGFITAVNVILGMNTVTKRVELFYQPVVLCYANTVSMGAGGTNCTHANYSVYCGSTYFSYKMDKFTQIPYTDVELSANAYTANVRIDHYPGDPDQTFQKPDPAKDAVGDVKSVLFSFREFDDVITSNNCDEVKIWNEIAVVDSKISGTMKKVRRHSLILSDKNSDGVSTAKKGSYVSAEFIVPKNIVNNKKAKAEFMAAYANLAHLCPPNCNIVTFRRSCP